jgi:hypothetical protein
MLTYESNTWDRVFVALLALSVIAVLVGIRLYANHLQAEKAAMAATEKEPKRVLHLEAITHVYECERDGQRVLTDRPCGSGVPIRVIEQPKRKPAQKREGMSGE